MGAVPSPDATRIAFIAQDDIWVMRADGSDARKLFPGEKGFSFEHLVWSPDGQRLAYLKSHRGYDQAVIESRALTGGEAVVAMSDPRLRSFSWAPNGYMFYAQLENLKDASTNIWEVRIDASTGRTSGKPERLSNWAGFTLMDVNASADGKRVAFVRKSDQSDVYVGKLEASGSRFKMPARLTLDDRMDWPGEWTRQGDEVLFFSDRDDNFDIFKQALNNPAAQEIAVGPSEEKRNPQLSPDGRWIIYLAWPNAPGDQPPSSGRLMRVPVSGGAPEFVADVTGYPGSARVPRERWLPTARGYPDFRCPAVSGRPCVLSEIKGEHLVFSAFDPLKGRQGELASIDVDPVDSFWDLSREGTRIAFGKCEPRDSHIRILDLTNGNRSQVTVKAWACLTSAGWSQNGKSLFVTNWASRGGSILRVMMNGETKVLRHALGMSLERPIASPDGRFLAYGEVETISNAWMIETQ